MCVYVYGFERCTNLSWKKARAFRTTRLNHDHGLYGPVSIGSGSISIAEARQLLFPTRDQDQLVIRHTQTIRPSVAHARFSDPMIFFLINIKKYFHNTIMCSSIDIGFNKMFIQSTIDYYFLIVREEMHFCNYAYYYNEVLFARLKFALIKYNN